MANVWFLADLHLGHKNICKFRTEFSSREEHENILKENYHSVVTKRDVVFFLGDVAFDAESLAEVSTWAGMQKILVVGNHCTQSVEMKQIVHAFDKVYSLLKYKEFWLSHCPIHPQELRGKSNIHGHVHNQSVDDHRYVNVSMENINYKPISLYQIRRMFK